MGDDETYGVLTESVRNPSPMYTSEGMTQGARKSSARLVDVENEDLDGDTLVYQEMEIEDGYPFTVVHGYADSDTYLNEVGNEMVDVTRVPEEDQEQVEEMVADLGAEEPININ